ncbi:MAG: replicative DNA helicase [Clostridia bacterium]|nr:replicative DNA helicase [Clostridia bacterium]
MPDKKYDNTPAVKKPRIFPNNFEAEQSALCCVLIDGTAARSVLHTLQPEDFYNERNKKIFRAMCELNRQDIPVDIITVFDYMEKNGLADENTLTYLTEINILLPSGANYAHYVKIIKRDSTLREVINKCNEIIAMAYEASDADAVVHFAEKKIYELSKERSRNELKHISAATIEVMERIEKLKKDKYAFRGLSTGFRIFDKVTNGLQDGDLIILAARPSVGKTAFALNIVAAAAERSDRPLCIAIYDLEMPQRQIAQRIMSNMGSVSMVDINSAELKNDGDSRLWMVTQKLSNTKIFINDSSMVSPAEVLSQCRRLGAEHNNGRVDLVIIDYLQLMNDGRTDKDRADNRQQEVSYMSRMMKIMARELNCPVLVLSQMSRGVEQRKGAEKTPMLSDLRESGAIEQDADIVMFLYRENDEDKMHSPIILDLAKHRNGELKKIRLNWQGEFMSFTESDDQTEYGKKNATPKPDFSSPAPSDGDE